MRFCCWKLACKRSSKAIPLGHESMLVFHEAACSYVFELSWTEVKSPAGWLAKPFSSAWVSCFPLSEGWHNVVRPKRRTTPPSRSKTIHPRAPLRKGAFCWRARSGLSLCSCCCRDSSRFRCFPSLLPCSCRSCYVLDVVVLLVALLFCRVRL